MQIKVKIIVKCFSRPSTVVEKKWIWH